MIEQDLAGSEGGLHARKKAPCIDHIARPRPGAKRERERGGGGGGSDRRVGASSTNRQELENLQSHHGERIARIDAM